MNDHLKAAINEYMKGLNEITNDNYGMKEIKAKQKQYKTLILEHMCKHNLPFIDIGEGTYLVIKNKQTKPMMNEEFIALAFKEFYNDPNRVKGDINSTAEKFGIYVFSLQKHMATINKVLHVTKKRPIASILMNDFKL